VDAWSLDAGELAPLSWNPSASLVIHFLGYQRAYYSLSESAEAEADFAWLKGHGSLPERAAKRVEPPARGGGQAASRNLVVCGLGYRLEAAQAKAFPGGLEILTPYVPHLKDWGREAPPEGGRLGILDQALWMDDLEALRGGQKAVTDDWQSPPPALGVLHFLAANLKKLSPSSASYGPNQQGK
jgi:hypothetical protein